MAQIYPANIGSTGLIADGSIIIPLANTFGSDSFYTVQVTSSFGGGTLTAFTNPKGIAEAKKETTYDIPITDSSGVAISKTSAFSFRFGCDSDSLNPNVLKLILTGSTSPTLYVRVDNNQ